MLSTTAHLRRWISTSTLHRPISSSPKPYLVVGLGNPGSKYHSTRHNVGFDMLDAFARSLRIDVTEVKCKALFGEGTVGDVPVMLAKPQTYMNLSGEAAGPLAEYYKLPVDRIVLIFDDMELPCGVLRLQPRGGHGGHKGVMNVIQHLRGNKEFVRLRIGIGKPPGQMDPKAFLLQKFNNTARAQIDAALEEGVVVLKNLVTKGLPGYASSVNIEQKYKHLKIQTSNT